MRKRAKSGDISVNAIAGTSVVLLGLDLAQSATKDFLGFAIERTDHTESERGYLENFLLLEANDRERPEPDHSSDLNPFQDFMWGDYTAKANHEYTYRVVAKYRGIGAKLRDGPSVSVRVETESEETGKHTILFNRGVAASQAYARRFGNANPADVPNREAYKWLSRGLFEGFQRFVGQAKDSDFGLRAAVYEFHYAPALEAFAVAEKAGADVQIVYDYADLKKGPGKKNEKAVKNAGLDDRAAKRERTSIAHNKFVVLLKKGKPVSVWTGSTNLTEGGIFGHSNTGHVVRDARVAQRYLDYWEQLSSDPFRKTLRTFCEADTAIPAGKPRANAVTTVFSPRNNLAALEWYAKLMDGAEESVFLTAAFGVSPQITAIFKKDRDYLRYLLLETERGEIDTIRRDPDNLVTAGGFVGTGGWRQWTEEKLTGFNNNVSFIHTKYMLIDPLSDDPIVITGSANFSPNSTNMNDENMLVIRGDERVADVYLGEFMRLFNHFRLRGRAKPPKSKIAPGPGAPPEVRRKLYLKDSDEWARRFYAKGSPEEKERLLFR